MKKTFILLLLLVFMLNTAAPALAVDTSAMNMSIFTAAEEYAYSKKSSYLTDYSAAKAKFKDTILLIENNSCIWINNRKYTSQYKVLWENEHFIAPADLLAALAGEKARLDGDTVTIGNFVGTVGERSVTVGGIKYKSDAAVQRIDGTVYVPVKEFAERKLKKYYSECEKGMAVIADKQLDLNASEIQTYVSEMLAYMILDRPNVNAIKAKFSKASGGGVHPRMYSSEQLKNILKLAETDSTLNSRVNSLINYGKKALNFGFSTGGHTILTSSFEVVEAMYAAYVKTGDVRYVKKAEELALLYAEMPTWNHETYFLDVSFWMLVCAEVYDLFYYQLSAETRDKIADAIIEKGLKHTQEHYYGSYSDWPKRNTNWNSVCNGGSMAAAAILLGDGHNDILCFDVLEKSFVSVGYQLHEFAPHGALAESTGYFGYGNQYLVRAVETYRNAFGDDFGIGDYPGFADMGYYPLYTDTNSGGWSLHDDGRNVKLSNVFASWSAYYTNDLMLQKARQEQIEKRGLTADFFDVIFYRSGNMPEKLDLPLDKSLGGGAGISTSRSDWGDEQFFMGIHAGANNCAHGQWDMGNFIYEAFGIRFATDIGNDSYSLGSEYFDEGGKKSLFYVHRTEAHNLYVINPDETAGQIWEAQSKVEEIAKNANGAAYKVDLTSAYSDKAEKAERGYMLTNGRSVLVVQDEIKTLNSGDEIKWFWQTAADIKINADNSVTLTKDGKTVTLYFDSNVSFTLDSGLGLPMDTSPTFPGQLQTGQVVNRLTATFKSGGEKVYFRCTAVPEGHEMIRGDIVPISDWTVPQVMPESDKRYFDADISECTSEESKDIEKHINAKLGGKAAVQMNGGTLTGVYDSEKGNRVARFKGSSEYWSGISLVTNVFTKDITAGNKLFFELSLKSDDYGANTGLQFFDGVWLFKINGTKVSFSGRDEREIETGKWYDFVFEITPGKTNGLIRCFMNGEQVSRWYNTKCTYDYMSAEKWQYNKVMFPETKTVLVDKFRAWSSAVPYNAQADGDVADLTVNSDKLVINNQTVEYHGLSTIGELSELLCLGYGSTAAYLDKDGQELKSPDTEISRAVRLAVRSASGDVVKLYKLKRYEPVIYFKGSTVKADISGLSSSEHAILYIAEYDENSRLLSVTGTDKPDGNRALSVNVGSTGIYKILLWNKENLTPYFAAREYLYSNGVWTEK